MIAPPNSPGYSDLVLLVEEIRSNSDADLRDISWVVPGELGLCRSPLGEVVVVLRSDELSPQSAVVARHCHQQPIYRAGVVAATETTMLSLPPLAHFDQFVAFICAEMLRQGAETDLESSFHATEPLIELAFTQHGTAERSLHALAARVLLLSRIVENSGDTALPRIMEAFCNSPAYRDLRTEGHGVIVRTSDQSASAVDINHPAEVSLDDDESSLTLLQLVLSRGLAGDGFDIPELVDRLVARLRTAAHEWVNPFISWVETFRRSDTFGYVHDDSRDSAFYGRQFSLDSASTINLASQSAGVLRTSDLATYPAVIPGSVSYKIRTRDAPVHGDPAHSLNELARQLAIAIQNR
ncbi:hypothetical protein [Aeromicrobium stalagmiti]|uniref:hypothetical protein n=1 Tax=Aeromicrobium stalagmiti TaxID=2738988 RepID=UPI00156852D2|nr:hypothetical protein [Aeromicrobium stalagmiti]NRQ50397.1 hypothetical protein [Aeromicrobium stalagmiti]